MPVKRYQQLEFATIARDAGTLNAVVRTSTTHAAAGVIGLAIPPCFAFFFVECSEWLLRSGIDRKHRFLGAYQRELRTLRASLKIFDDTRTGADGVERR